MIYLASPYTHEDPEIMQLRFEKACIFCAAQARAGVIIYSPIVHWHPVACLCDLPREHGFWTFHDHDMIARSQEVWVLKLPGWNLSRGVQSDLDVAVKHMKEVRYIES